MSSIRTKDEIGAMRESGAMLAHVLQLLKKKAVAGITTGQLDDLAADELKKLGGTAAFLGYSGFPRVLCVSINQEVVHGIPRDDCVLESGDIVGMDFGVRYKGMITDGAITIIIDEPKSKQHEQLLKVTEQALMAGINTVKHGVHTGDIGFAIEQFLNRHRLGIVRDLVGHGVGHQLHEEPNIPNYGSKGEGPILKAGMTVAIEPMATLGGDGVYIAEDGWTVVTQDHSLAAHFEHTVLVTGEGAEILTTL